MIRLNTITIWRALAAAAAIVSIAGCSANSGATGAGATTTTTTSAAQAAAQPTVTLSVSPGVIQPGGTATLTWNTTGADACLASGGWSGSQALSNSTGVALGPINVAGVYSYGLTCTGAGGSGSNSVTLIVGTPPAPQVSLQLTPAAIQPGDTATLTWAAANATSCTGSGGTSGDNWSATQPAVNSTGFNVGPFSSAGTYSYVLTCTGAGGSASDSRILTVSSTAPAAPPAITFSATPTQIAPLTGKTTLTWNATNATSCTASGGAVADGWAGSAVATSSSGRQVGPIALDGTYTYTLSCTGAGGTASQQVTVNVTSNPQTAAPTLLISVSPTEIAAGNSAALSWTTTNANACLASGSWAGIEPLSGSAVSTGTILLPGAYSYTLTCTGPGGTATGTASLTVDPAPASVVSFLAVPQILPLTGLPSTLSWVTTDATSCTASGGSGSDNWGGPVATSNPAYVLPAFSAAGNFTYTLNCSGPGGASAASSVTITVGLTAPPAATIGSFTAAPTSVTSGQSTTLSWSSSNASSCTATGGTGNDGWTGAVPTSSSGFVVGPIGNIGTVNYTLTCTGSGGTSAPSTVPVTVTQPPPGSPTVSIMANGSNPAQIQPGAALTLSWTSANTTSCTATGGTGAGDWGGAQPLTSPGVALNAINVPGIYSYILTCTGPSGSAAASVLVTVISSSAADCNVGFPTTALLSPAASASGGVSGLCLLGGCSVTNLPNLTNANQTDFATISIPVGVGATGALQVSDSATTFPAGRRAGFVIAPTSAQLSAGLVPNVTVRTLKGGVIQESSTVNNSLQLSAVGLLSDPNAGFAGFTTTKSFDSVRLEVTAPALVLSKFDVYESCVSLQ